MHETAGFVRRIQDRQRPLLEVGLEERLADTDPCRSKKGVRHAPADHQVVHLGNEIVKDV